MFEDFPKELKNALSGNFCAMKYVAALPKRKQKKLCKRAKNMNENELREFVSVLGKRFT